MNQTIRCCRAGLRRIALMALSVGCVVSMGSGVASAAVNKDVALTGAGATFPQNIIQQWAADAKNSGSMGFTVNYTGVGSGAGRTNFINNTVDFAGSDVPFSSDEASQATASRGTFVYVTETGGGVALMFKLAGVSSLRLSAANIGKVFKGTITKWNDPLLVSENPGTTLPAEDIVPIVRSDKSGTSAVFSDYLSKATPDVWTTGSNGQFPVPANGKSAKGSDGVAGQVKATEGAIGYAELSYAVENSLPYASVKNASGAFVAPTAGSVTAAIDDGTINSDGTVTMNYTTTVPSAYPISTVSYIIAPTSMDKDKGDNLKAFLTYAVGSTGQSRAAPLSYAPLPKKIADNDKIQIAKINPSTPAASAAQAPALETGKVGDPSTTTAAATAAQIPAATTPATTSAAPTGKVLAASTGPDPTSTTTPAGTGGPDILIGVAGVALVAAGELVRRKARTAN